MTRPTSHKKQSHSSSASEPAAPMAAAKKRASPVTTKLPAGVVVPTPPVVVPTVSQPPVVQPTVTPTSLGTVPATTSSSPTAIAVTAPAKPNALTDAPDVTIPSPPDGFLAPDMREFSGCYPSTKELAAASTAIADLGMFTSYLALLGSSAPPAATISSALSLGLAWRNVRNLTAAWDAYVKAQDAMAWKAALTLMDELKPLFLSAVAKNPELATQYEGLARMFAAPKVSAKEAAVTRKKNAASKAAAASAAAALSAAAATASAVATAKVEATAAATPTKAVTVTV